MSKERIEGATQKGVGSLKEAVGKVVGNDRLVAEGLADRAVGTAKEALSARRRTPCTRPPANIRYSA